MSSVAGRLSAPGARRGPVALVRRRAAAIAIPADAAVCLGVATVLAVVAFGASGGTQIARTSYTDIALVLIGAALVALALVRGGARRLHGGWTLAGLAALSGLTALSIAWSLAPSDTWFEASRMLGYLGAFAGGLALVRLAPSRWPAVLAGIALGGTVVTIWALLSRVFPGALAPGETFVRLQAPFEYWNAIGLWAVLAVPPLLWLAAKRSGNLAANALAYPGLGLAFVALMLSYSRGALLAVILAVAFWLVLVPLRLRAATALACSGSVAAIVVAWAFGQPGLTEDRLPLIARTTTGHAFGLLLLLASAILLAIGLAVGFAAANRPPRLSTRRHVGRALIALLAVLSVIGLVTLSAKPGGIDGQVSKGYRELTDPAAVPPNNSPGRLTATSSVRSRYWREAFDIWADHRGFGAGAGAFPVARTRYRKSPLEVRQAHGYLPETVAGLGFAGLAVSVLLLVAWLVAAGRATGLRRGDRGLPMDAERVGLLTFTSVVIAFGVHSFVDWTWLVPGTAVLTLLCVAWVAGRGPLRDRLAGTPAPEAVPDAPARSRVRTIAAAAVVLVALAMAWAIFQPLRSVHAGDAAFDRLDAGQPAAAVETARIAVERNPLSIDARFDLASILDATGRPREAERALEGAVELEPANATAWRRLGEYRVSPLNDPKGALAPLRAAYYLDPASPDTAGAFLTVRRALATKPAP